MADRPYMVLHNSVSLDGSVTGFEVDMQTHYQLASSFESDANLTGSGTVLAGLEMYGDSQKDESQNDFRHPDDNGLPPWIIVGSRGRLEGKLHALRNSEFGGDPIVLVSEATPSRFLSYLSERDYRHHVVGSSRVELVVGLELLRTKYGFKTLLVDSGPGLNGALLNLGLINHLSLLVVPVIAGAERLPLMRDVSPLIELKLADQEQLGQGVIWLRYDVTS